MTSHKVLIIDADVASRDFIAQALREAGHEVLTAASANEGLALAQSGSPDVVLADPLTGDMPGEELTAHFRSDPLTAHASLIALGSDPRPARLRAALDAGFDDYQSKSFGLPALLAYTIADLLDREARPDRQGGLLIVFVSAKGGLGTSSLCANLAKSAAENEPGRHVVVADLVLPMGSISEIVGYAGQQNIVSVTHRPASEVTPDFLRLSLPRMDSWGFHLLAGAINPDRGNELDFLHIQRTIVGLQSAYDYVLLDLGRSLSRIGLPLIEQADLIVLTANADRTTVALTTALWDHLRSKDVQASSVYLVLNRTVPLEGLTRREVERTIGLPIRAALPYLGENLSLANNAHQPYAAKFRENTATFLFRQMAQDMVTAARRERER
jgi:pilus assembly protein CpaE